MEDTTPSPRTFVRDRLPWLIAAAAVLLYLITLNPWVGINSLPLTAQMGGWENSLPYTRPLLWVASLPLHLLPASQLPYAANVLAALFAAASLGTLARCVALLPHDRTREQRMRGHSDHPLLHIPLAWLPPVFAVLLVGLQLSFWEDATAQTGEMLDLLIFATCIRCLLEYRRDLRDVWMWRFALLYGVGTAGNWAMIGFGPLFVIALCWIRGLAILNVGFLLRLAAWFGAGLLTYLLMPIVSQVQQGGELGFWPVLRETLGQQRMYLLGLPRSRLLLLSLVNLLPLVLVGIRWQGGVGSKLESMISSGAVLLLKIGFFGVAIYMAFDPAFSPRQLVRLDPQSGSLPLLTFSFVAALAASYFAGYFVLIGSRNPEHSWDRPSGFFSALSKLGFGLTVLAMVAGPAAIAWRNWPVIRAQNGPALDRLARNITAQLPAKPAVLISDDATLHLLLVAQLTRETGGAAHLLFNSQLAPQASYRQWLARRHAAQWPEMAELATSQDNMSLPLLRLISRAATNQIAFFLSPSLNFITEYLQPRPVGAIYRLTTYPVGNVNAAQLTPAETTAVSAYWNKVRPELNDLVRDVKLGALNVRQTAGLWARTANNDGVLLQQSDHPTEAAPLFELALKLNPDNVAAAVNLRVNTALRGHQAITDDVRKPMSGKSVSSILTEHGLLDEPKALFAIARGANIADPSLPRAAAIRFLRALQLDPTYTSAAFGYISACLNAQEPGLALTAIRELRAKEKLEPDSLEKLLRLEFGAHIIRGDTAAAEQLLLQARVEQPQISVPLQLLSELYLEKKRYAEALQQLDLWQALKVGGEDIPLRRVVIYMSQQQFDPALPLLDKILRDQPENEIARANRAICLLQLNRFDDSRRDYEVLLKKYPDRYSLHYGLGELAEKKKDPAEARKHFQRYLELAPPNTTEYTNVFARVRQLKGGN